MKGFLKSLIATAIFAVALVSTTSAASADRWVKIRNQTSVILYRWYASPSSSNSWGPDRLVSKQIPPGYTSTIWLDNAGSGCSFDFRAEFKDGDVLEKYGVNVCGGITWTYTD
jgi:opacity protein-like surface antigen